jgi:hypothetical protein
MNAAKPSYWKLTALSLFAASQFTGCHSDAGQRVRTSGSRLPIVEPVSLSVYRRDQLGRTCFEIDLDGSERVLLPFSTKCYKDGGLETAATDPLLIDATIKNPSSIGPISRILISSQSIARMSVRFPGGITIPLRIQGHIGSLFWDSDTKPESIVDTADVVQCEFRWGKSGEVDPGNSSGFCDF